MSIDKTDLAIRMKRYESISQISLTPRMPLIIRLDGRSFSKYTKGFEKPWDLKIRQGMSNAAIGLMSDIQGAEIAYLQSDEITLLINSYKYFKTQAWFDNNLQKICSISASIATAFFNDQMKNALWNYTTVCTCTDSSHTHWKPKTKLANFDSRAFVVPKEDVCNAFYWRQVDAIRNSISGYAQKHFSHKQLHKKNRGDMKEMLKEKGIIWEDLDPWTRHGWCVIRNGSNVECDYNIPNFSQDRSYIEKYIAQIEE